MSNKRFDFSVLPDGFLIEWNHGDARKEIEDRYLGSSIRFARLSESLRQLKGWRPALNYWHFNDGSMVLPDGLVVYVFRLDHGQNEMYRCHIDGGLVTESMVEHCFFGHDISCNYELFQISQDVTKGAGIKVIGAHPDYAEHAKELDMPVVEI